MWLWKSAIYVWDAQVLSLVHAIKPKRYLGLVNTDGPIKMCYVRLIGVFSLRAAVICRILDDDVNKWLCAYVV